MLALLSDHWEALAVVVAFVFNAGITWQNVRNKPSVKQVASMIETAFENHCTFADRILKLEVWKTEIVADNIIIAKTLVSETERTHLASQRIELNLKRVCDKMDIGYLQ